MAQQSHPTIDGVYGPGSHTDHGFVPVPQEAERIFRLLASQTPGFTADGNLLSKVRFKGESFPVIPGPIKAIEVASALHAMSGVVAEEILAIRGAASAKRLIEVNTTHVGFWFGTAGIGYINGLDVATHTANNTLDEIVPDHQFGWIDTPLKYRTTALYPTKNPEVWYSLHGSLDAEAVLKSMGINDPGTIKTNEDAWEHIASFTRKMLPEEIEFHNILHGFCGSICFTPAGWNSSEMGRDLAQHPLVNVKPQLQAVPTPPIAFPPFNPNDKRPLAGIKVLEVTRIIAGPQIGAVLSSYGADVIRVSPPHLRDLNLTQLTLNAGKRTVPIDMRKEEDRAYVLKLVREADIFVQGFRQRKMEKYGLGLNDLLQIAAERQKGFVYVSENCYGPDGYYAERPGWQQIADAAAGSSYVTGRALKLPENECVLPSLPISDMSTGIVGALGAMMGIRDRAIKGGSYFVHASLTKVDAYALTPEIGLYPPEVVEETRKRFQFDPMRGAHHVIDLLVNCWFGWKRLFGDSYLKEGSGWYQHFDESAFGGGKLSILRPIVRLTDSDSTPEWRSPSVPHCFYQKENVQFE